MFAACFERMYSCMCQAALHLRSFIEDKNLFLEFMPSGHRGIQHHIPLPLS